MNKNNWFQFFVNILFWKTVYVHCINSNACLFIIYLFYTLKKNGVLTQIWSLMLNRVSVYMKDTHAHIFTLYSSVSALTWYFVVIIVHLQLLQMVCLCEWTPFLFLAYAPYCSLFTCLYYSTGCWTLVIWLSRSHSRRTPVCWCQLFQLKPVMMAPHVGLRPQ